MLAIGWMLWASPGVAFGDTGDTGAATDDTGDTSTALEDTGAVDETGSPEDTDEPGAEDTGDANDTGEGPPDDTDVPLVPTPVPPSAAALTGETGGFGCTASDASGGLSFTLAALMLLWRLKRSEGVP